MPGSKQSFCHEYHDIYVSRWILLGTIYVQNVPADQSSRTSPRGAAICSARAACTFIQSNFAYATLEIVAFFYLD